MNEQPKCDCGKPASFFHSRCCNAHFEGVIYENGKWAVVCEKCNKFGAYIIKSPTPEFANQAKENERKADLWNKLYQKAQKLISDFSGLVGAEYGRRIKEEMDELLAQEEIPPKAKVVVEREEYNKMLQKAEAWDALLSLRAETKDKEPFVDEVKETMQTIWDLVEDELLAQSNESKPCPVCGGEGQLRRPLSMQGCTACEGTGKVKKIPPKAEEEPDEQKP